MYLIILTIIFSLTFWLGLYLLHRDFTDPRLRWTGLGLMVYALGMGGFIVRTYYVTTPDSALPPHFWWILSLPALFWMGAALHLLPAEQPIRIHLDRFWRYGQVPLILLLAPLFVAAGTVPNSSSILGVLHAVLALAILLPLMVILVLIGRAVWVTQPRRLSGLLIVAMIFFGLSMITLLLPIMQIEPLWMLIGIGGDLLLLGFAIVEMDAFDQGETLLPDLLLALDAALLYVLLFGGLVGATMLFSTGATPSMVMLLLTTIAAAIAVQMFAPSIQETLDRIALGRQPDLVEDRAELRALADALPRQIVPRVVISDPVTNPPDELIDATTVPAEIPTYLQDEDEFARLTRRALSHMEDLGKLSASALVDLPVVTASLQERAAPINSLERAQTLKALLTEAVEQLKPADGTDFGTTGQWRYYNALYFPYVIGLKPYSRRATYTQLEAAPKEALEWFRSQVPERTLYNWQTAAARLVAQYLRELSVQKAEQDR